MIKFPQTTTTSNKQKLPHVTLTSEHFTFILWLHMIINFPKDMSHWWKNIFVSVPTVIYFWPILFSVSVWLNISYLILTYTNSLIPRPRLLTLAFSTMVDMIEPTDSVLSCRDLAIFTTIVSLRLVYQRHRLTTVPVSMISWIKVRPYCVS
jgi:hypothetical protein